MTGSLEMPSLKCNAQMPWIKTTMVSAWSMELVGYTLFSVRPSVIVDTRVSTPSPDTCRDRRLVPPYPAIYHHQLTVARRNEDCSYFSLILEIVFVRNKIVSILMANV